MLVLSSSHDDAHLFLGSVRQGKGSRAGVEFDS